MVERDPSGPWEKFWSDFDGLRAALRRSSAVNVNAAPLKARATDLVRLYFNEVRPELVSLQADPDEVMKLDANMQDLTRLAQGSNAKQSYLRLTQIVAANRPKLTTSREMLRGERLSVAAVRAGEVRLEVAEKNIIETLSKMLPSAALSYEQAVKDLSIPGRLSFRGVAVELRECLREVLDHLAPDEAVMKVAGFKLEGEQKKPTMRQKARFVFRSRELSDTAIKAPEDAVSAAEERAASLVRSTYERGNVSTHVATTRAEVKQLKMYVDSALADLLQIHRVSTGHRP